MCKDRKAVKLSKHHKTKCVSHVNKYMKTELSTVILTDECRATLAESGG